MVVAGILHDTIEDRGITKEQIENTFGEDVARIVESVTEPPKTEPWEYRKRHTIELMRTASEEALAVTCADTSSMI